MDMLEEPFCVKIYKKNAAHTFPGTHFVWKFTGKKTRTDSAQRPFCVKIYSKNAGPSGAHLDQTRPLLLLL